MNCFVLDLDDTLYSERDYVRSGFTAVGALVANRLGLQGFGEACWHSFVSGERGRTFDKVLQRQYGIVDAAIVAELVEAYRSHTPQIQLYPDAQQFITRAREFGQPLALITDGPQLSQRAKIDALGLQEFFSPIVVTAELGPGKSKPDPASYEIVQQSLGPHRRYSYIADNPNKDFLAPNRLGWTSIRIQRAAGLHCLSAAPTRAHEPHHTVTSLDDIWDCTNSKAPPCGRASHRCEWT